MCLNDLTCRQPHYIYIISYTFVTYDNFLNGPTYSLREKMLLQELIPFWKERTHEIIFLRNKWWEKNGDVSIYMSHGNLRATLVSTVKKLYGRQLDPADT